MDSRGRSPVSAESQCSPLWTGLLDRLLVPQCCPPLSFQLWTLLVQRLWAELALGYRHIYLWLPQGITPFLLWHLSHRFVNSTAALGWPRGCSGDTGRRSLGAWNGSTLWGRLRLTAEASGSPDSQTAHPAAKADSWGQNCHPFGVPLGFKSQHWGCPGLSHPPKALGNSGRAGPSGGGADGEQHSLTATESACSYILGFGLTPLKGFCAAKTN